PMIGAEGEAFRQARPDLDARGAKGVTDLVDLALQQARQGGASDVHLTPTPSGLEMRWRIDGVLHLVDVLPLAVSPNVVARLKVLSDLLTYRTDVPQEGRIRSDPGEVEMRVSTFPTLHGEKAVVRLFAASGHFERLNDLGLPGEIRDGLSELLRETSGAVVFAGPAGSGKTTTLYACLREIASISGGSRSLASLEDPIEAAVSGVAQSQVNPSVGFDLAAGVRSLLRQDPEVIAVGEIRDRGTAEGALGASLTGHLVLTTFHAGSASGLVGRLLDMGIEPYVLRSGLLAVVCQRLARRLCECSVESSSDEARLGLPVATVRLPAGCSQCGNTGYSGRLALAEWLVTRQGEVARAVLEKQDVRAIESAAIEAGMVPLGRRAVEAVERGLTSPQEVRRVLGVSRL
ncbi:MAG TPA: GspE/PulE family protein, partial [Isosphaeraceae bacterium]|nr:GspE/PulE family protein [Isosphaeraceae bacterium]